MRLVANTLCVPLCGLMLLLACGCGKKEIPDGTLVSIVYSSDVRGKLEGCGCKHNGGGITKRGAKIKAARAEDATVLYCDAGNFLTGTAEVDSTQGMLSVEAYNQLGASVVNVSERELAFGLEAFKKAKAESKFEFVSANVKVDGSSVAAPYAIKVVKDARVAFIGLCGARSTMRYDSLKLPPKTEIGDPVAAIRSALDGIGTGADLIVLLSTCGDAVDSMLATAFPNIQLIIGGRSYRANCSEPWVLGETRIVRADRDGRTLGRMDMVFGSQNKLKMYNPAVINMETSDPSDSEMLALIRKRVPGFTDNPTEGVRILNASAQ